MISPRSAHPHFVIFTYFSHPLLTQHLSIMFNFSLLFTPSKISTTDFPLLFISLQFQFNSSAFLILPHCGSSPSERPSLSYNFCPTSTKKVFHPQAAEHGCHSGYNDKRMLTFPKSLTSNKSNASKSSLFFIPNISQHAERKVLMFFKQRN